MRLLDYLFRASVSASGSDPELTTALDRAAGRVDPRLKQARGWPKRFSRPVGAALAQARRVAQAIPGPIELDAGRYSGDPLIRALFTSADDIHRHCRDSDALRDYAAGNDGDEAYVLLSARREEKQTFGMEEHNGILRRDVPQQVVWFTDHRFMGPAATPAEARDKLTWTLFERFLERLAVGVERLRADKARLAREKELTLSRLKNAEPLQRVELRRALTNVLKQLGEATESLELEHMHEVFETVLSHPEDCLYLEECRLTLDAMGVVCPESNNGDALTLAITELFERYHERRTVFLAHCRGLRSVFQEPLRPEAYDRLL